MTRILLVDDLFENQEILAEIMSSFGFEYAVAGCVQGAIELATTQPFDAVIMDLGIPNTENGSLNVMGGLEASRAILAHPSCRELPIVAFTNRRSKDVEQAVRQAGLKAVLEKGPRMDQRLQAMLQTLLQLAPETAELEEAIISPSILASVRQESLHAASSDARSVAGLLVETQEQVTLTIETSQNSSLEPQATPGAHKLAESPLPHATASVKEAILSVLHTAQRTAEQLQEAVLELEIDDKQARFLSNLRRQLAESLGRLCNPQDGPAPGEPLGHWIGGLILGAHSSCRKLANSDQEHFEKFATSIADITGALNECYTICRSDAAQVIPRPRTDTNSRPERQAVPECPTPVSTTAELSSQTSTTFHLSTQTTLEVAATLEDDQALVAKFELGDFPIVQNAIPAPLILVVDDENAAREDLETKLKELNEYQVVSCNDPLTALKLMELIPIDVCLLDLTMPGMDGLELLDHIRRSPRTTNTSIIVVSGSQKAVAAIERGADDYITKPADSALLSARIKSCLRKTQARIEELSKFLPTHVLKSVLNNSSLLEQAVPADISVIVCDVRGFSRVSERIGPVQTIAWISDVMNRLSQVILNNGGTIVDYVGDEIMAMWGAPIATTCHADQACRCAIAIQAEVDCLVEKWRSKIHGDFSIGIGINSGLAVVGNTGSKLRFKYGPLGNTVNVASRVQGATKYLHSRILVSQNTASRVSGKMLGRRICSVRVQNINEPVSLYELNEGSDNSPKEFSCYEAALQAFEAQRYDEAIQILAQLLSVSTNDGPSKLLMSRAIQSQLGGNFDPVWTLPGK